MGRRQRSGGRLIGDHLDNRRAFGHDLAAVEAQRWDLALGTQLQIILTIFERLGPDIDLDQLVGQVGGRSASRSPIWGDREQVPGE